MKLRRDERVRMFMIGQNNFEIRTNNDDVLKDSNEDYFIYLQNVNFRSGNIIEGRYLGELTGDSPLLDDNCKTVRCIDDKFFIGNSQIRTAKMVAINNKKSIIVIITQT